MKWRAQIVLAAALVVGAGAAAGGGLAAAGHSRFGVSFRTPRGWARVDWCWNGANFEPIALLTTAKPAPTCSKPALGVSASWPPPLRLGVNGAGIVLTIEAVFPGAKERWNARVAGRPARVARPVYGRRYDMPLACPAGVRREFRAVAVQPRGAMNETLRVEAVLCGPDLAAGQASFRRVLRSVRFTG